MEPHPKWEKMVEDLQEFGTGCRFISVGMNQQLPKHVDLHRVDLHASDWLNRSNLRYTRETADTRWCAHFAGIRLWFHKEHQTYLPYPPERDIGREDHPHG